MLLAESLQGLPMVKLVTLVSMLTVVDRIYHGRCV
jgi:hypothetical protein